MKHTKPHTWKHMLERVWLTVRKVAKKCTSQNSTLTKDKPLWVTAEFDPKFLQLFVNFVTKYFVLHFLASEAWKLSPPFKELKPVKTSLTLSPKTFVISILQYLIILLTTLTCKMVGDYNLLTNYVRSSTRNKGKH